MNKKRGQASLEYTFIVGIALIMIMPLILIYMNNQTTVRDDVNIIQAKNIVNSIVDNSEKVYFIGSPSKTTIEVRMPETISDVIIENNKVTFKIRTAESVLSVSKYSDVNLTGSLDPLPGLREIVITAQENNVKISEK
ncbi:MAG: hypothetical protein ACQESF_03060 [Nanobdellota archaeon]